MATTNTIREVNGIELAENQCPRCLGYIPNNDQPGAYPGALSRMTRSPRDEQVFVCSKCGEDEALGQALGMGNGYVPVNLWPIATDTTPEEVLATKRVISIRFIR